MKTMTASTLPKGIGTWVYRYSKGVSAQVKRFNAAAQPELQFKYLFPYACGVSFNPAKKLILIKYHAENTRQYAETLPSDVRILAIVDGRTDHGEFDGWTEAEYHAAAAEVAKSVLDDPYATGVQIDIEPFNPNHLPFYKQLRTLLNAQGKISTMFVGPWGDEVLAKIFEACDILVLSGYDLTRENPGAKKYHEALSRAVARVQKVAEQEHGHYLVGIPVAASWGEYEYIAGGDEGRQESGTKQEDYVRAALEVVKQYQQYPEYLGTALWHMSDPDTDKEEPEKATEPTKYPNIIRPGMWKMLEKY